MQKLRRHEAQESRAPGVEDPKSPGVLGSRNQGFDESRSLGVTGPSPGAQESRRAGVQGPAVQESRRPKDKDFRSRGIQESSSSGVQESRNPGVHGPRVPGVQGSRAARRLGESLEEQLSWGKTSRRQGKGFEKLGRERVREQSGRRLGEAGETSAGIRRGGRQEKARRMLAEVVPESS